MPKSYSNQSAQELREMLLNGTLQAEALDLEEYEKLFGYELELADPDPAVLNFCTEGLDRYKEYDVDIRLSSLDVIIKRAETQSSVPRKPYRKRSAKRLIIAIAAIIGVLILATATAATMGIRLVDLVKQALNSPDKTYSSKEDFVSVDTAEREYNSLDEMLVAENLDIMYPEKLPTGYEFTFFMFQQEPIVGNTLIASNGEPFIEFIVMFDPKFQEGLEYEYETNGIKYMILSENDRHQVMWVDGTYCYWLVVSDETVITEIIENLRRVK